MTSKSCKSCGHIHFLNSTKECLMGDCKCKKFEGQNQSQLNERVGEDEGLSLRKHSPDKPEDAKGNDRGDTFSNPSLINSYGTLSDLQKGLQPMKELTDKLQELGVHININSTKKGFRIDIEKNE